jgi:crossover junction endodeoxyribonuclease RuvC
MLACGAIRSSSRDPLNRRLAVIHRGILDVIRTSRPTEVAVEGIFYHRNVRSTVTLAYARAVVLLAAEFSSLPVAEYDPMRVKQAIVGYGRAAKEQVAYMVRRLLLNPEEKMLSDVSDALAVALCHAQSDLLARRLEAGG